MMMANDIDFKLLKAESKATEIVEDFGITAPEHIRIRDIAYSLGAMVVEQHLEHAAASIVKVGNYSTIRIPPTDTRERKRFSIAHELGHLLMNHVESIQRVCSNNDMINWYQNNQETQANFFASELLLPSKLVKRRCDVKNIDLRPVREIAKDFRASLTATAIKFVRLCPEKCAIIYSIDGKIKWFYKSDSFWPFIRKDKRIDKRTAAYDFFAGKPMDKEPIDVDGDAWVESSGVDEIMEHSLASSKYGAVISMLWIKQD